MTDRECLQQIIDSLDLEPSKEGYPDENEFAIFTNATLSKAQPDGSTKKTKIYEQVVLGQGNGYMRFYHWFDFDADGKCTGHGSAE